MTPSKILFYFCISLIIGIAMQSFLKIPPIFIGGFLIFSVILISIYFIKAQNIFIVLGFCLVFFTVGVLCLQISQRTVSSDALKEFNDLPAEAGRSEKITVIGIISAEPDIRNSQEKLKVTTEKLILNGQEIAIKGTVLVTIGNFGSSYAYHYLDTVQITGKLKTPMVFEDFNYKNYLMKDGIYSVMDYPTVEIISKTHRYTPVSYVYEKILQVKQKLIHSIEVNLFPPHSFILEGMVFGQDQRIPSDLKDQFNATGLSHVTAVSGTNIVIIISMLTVLLLYIGLWRSQAFYVSVIFIWTYIILIGFPASGVRAAIMGCITLLAQKLGRQNTSARVLILTAALMLVQNPFLLNYDIGFQLSFLASLGIIYIKPLIDMFFASLFYRLGTIGSERLKTTLKRSFSFIFDLISITLAAQIITLPIIVYNFGRVSLVAPLTNLLALPVVEVLTILGFLLSVCAALIPPLGFIFSMPCWFLLTYFLKILAIFSKPWAIKTIEDVSPIWVAIYYIILASLLWFLYKRQKPKFLEY